MSRRQAYMAREGRRLLGCCSCIALLVAVPIALGVGFVVFMAREATRTNSSNEEESKSARLLQSKRECEAIAQLPPGAEREQRGREWMARYFDCLPVDGDFEQQARFWQAMNELEAIGKLQDQDEKRRAARVWINKYPDLASILKDKMEAATKVDGIDHGERAGSGIKMVPVKGFTRKNETYVHPHMRSAPGSGGRGRH